ncbi:MAG: ABC transporter substrate-binding protein, partial [Lachnospiraceae bacterium]|nr:ABC transporter substrate-binding protein [Lachnospiraceae bacterium]
TDDLVRVVTVESAERVACLLESFTDTWLLAGGNVAAAVDGSWENTDLELDDSVIRLGSSMNPEIEAVIAASPDLCLASAQVNGQLELEEQLTQAGITVAYFNVSDFDEYLHMLDICTDITGRKDLYEENGLSVEEEIEEVLLRTDGSAPTVLYLRASSTSIKAKGSSGSVGSEILYNLGCVNIADSDESLLEELSMEAIIEADPEYIFVVPYGNNMAAAEKLIEEQLLSNPAWASLTAVREGNYYVLDKRLYHLKPNAKWGEAYRGLADILYP